MALNFTEAWQRFWYVSGGTFNLGLFRILFAVCLFHELSATEWFSVFAIKGGFHLPYVWFIQPVTPDIFRWMVNLQYPLILLLAVGLFSRVSCGALLLLQGYIFFADQMNFRNHPYFYLLVLLLLLFSPLDDALSLKSILRAWKNRQPLFESVLGNQSLLTFQRLIQVQVCIVYIYAALQKMNATYLNGTLLEIYIREEFLRGKAGKILEATLSQSSLFALMDFLYSGPIFVGLAILSLALELFIPLALWHRKTRPLAIILGVAFHFMLYLAMDVFGFSFAMIGTYLLFIDPEALVARVRAMILRHRAGLKLKVQS